MHEGVNPSEDRDPPYDRDEHEGRARLQTTVYSDSSSPGQDNSGVQVRWYLKSQQGLRIPWWMCGTLNVDLCRRFMQSEKGWWPVQVCRSIFRQTVFLLSRLSSALTSTIRDCHDQGQTLGTAKGVRKAWCLHDESPGSLRSG